MGAKEFLTFIDGMVMDTVRQWTNQIENKFIQYQYKANDALSRKIKLNRQMEDAIDVFGFGLLNEKKILPSAQEKSGAMDEDVLVVDDDDMWMEWENQERIKMETIRNNLQVKSTEKRVSNSKSVLTSE